ncbi:4-hydroxy-tetrahydrodipicolinate synthase [Candidatus Vidania fulgoroideae]|nr:4-hydroxy-tetrahydrodipicolinate synthase [Candidatus Vidania fulgoroideae]
MFKGNITSLITPFKKNGSVDFKSIKKIIEFQCRSGIKNILINATTGESCSLNFKEQKRIINFVCKNFHKKIGIMVGSCHNSLEESLKTIKISKRKEIKAILQIIPYYNNPTKKGIVSFFKKICRSTKKPVLIYNVPSRTGFDIDIDTLREVFKIDNLIGIKEASKKIDDVIEKIILCKKKGKKFFFGDDLMYISFNNLKVDGNISVATNIIPKEFKNIKFNLKKIKKIKKILNVLFIETNPIPLKYIMSKLGIIKKRLRRPLCSPKKKNKIKIIKVFKKYFKKENK